MKRKMKHKIVHRRSAKFAPTKHIHIYSYLYMYYLSLKETESIESSDADIQAEFFISDADLPKELLIYIHAYGARKTAAVEKREQRSESSSQVDGGALAGTKMLAWTSVSVCECQ